MTSTDSKIKLVKDLDVTSNTVPKFLDYEHEEQNTEFLIHIGLIIPRKFLGRIPYARYVEATVFDKPDLDALIESFFGFNARFAPKLPRNLTFAEYDKWTNPPSAYGIKPVELVDKGERHEAIEFFALYFNMP